MPDVHGTAPDIFEHVLGSVPPTKIQQQPTPPQQSHVTKQHIEQKQAADQAYAHQRYTKLQEEIRALQHKREEEDRKRLEAMEEEKITKGVSQIQQQPLGAVVPPGSGPPIYRTENKVGKARE